LGTIDDLLDFTKIEAGKLTLESTQFSLRALVDDTLRALSVRSQRKGLKLVCDIVSEIPDGLVGDPGRLRQVLLNLVGNAIKFTEHGEVLVHVGLDASDDPPSSDVRLRCAIRDTGVGIPHDKQQVIFRAFEQEDMSTTRKYGGTGLGLTIAARLVALMEGNLGVESEPGRGSTFTFTARFGRAQDDPAGKPIPAARSGLQARAKVHAGPTLRVLVAEDNELNCELMQQLLLSHGHEVRLATTGREALMLAESEAYDVLLLDVHMPELDGFSVAQAIRERERSTGKHLPVIAVTARARAEDRRRCFAAGMDGFIAKPIDAAELRGAIDRFAGAAKRPATS
jgi:CheY-like chemotaxis protein